MKRRAIIGLAPIALLAACSDGASLDEVAEAKVPEAPVTIHLSPPPECREALDRADELLEIATEGLSRASDVIVIAGDAFSAIVDLDLNALNAVPIGEIEAAGQWFTDQAPVAGAARTAYDAAKAACLSA